MKKITNNALWGRITMLLDLVLVVLMIVSVVFLMKYDKVNVQYQKILPGFNNLNDSVVGTKDAIHHSELNIANYLKAKDSISLAKENQLVNTNKERLSVFEKELSPIMAQKAQLENEMQSPLKLYNVFICLVIAIFIIKIALFAVWTYKNMQNLHAVAPWMKKGMHPIWAFLAWIIPFFNLVKPCSFFSELWDETNYLLKKKAIVANEDDNNQMEFLGIWWGLTILAKCIVPFMVGGLLICVNFWWLIPNFISPDVLNMGVFFAAKGFFVGFNHTLMAVLMGVIWIGYLLYDAYLIYRYNKLAAILVENQAKFVEGQAKK